MLLKCDAPVCTVVFGVFQPYLLVINMNTGGHGAWLDICIAVDEIIGLKVVQVIELVKA